MPIPRKALVDYDLAGCYHVVSRCVRRAFLCGDQAEHRRAMVLQLVRQAAGAFTVDVLAYAIMANHLHLVVRTDLRRVGGLTATDVANRWAAAHPRLASDGTRTASDPGHALSYT